MHELIFIITKLFVSVITIIFMIRLLGRKGLSQNTPLDFCLMVILGGVVSIIATGEDYSILDVVIIIVEWCLMIALFDFLKMRWKMIKDFFQGSPIVIISHGVIQVDVMRRERMTYEELLNKLRMHGVFNPSEVEVAYLEINGEISVKRKGK